MRSSRSLYAQNLGVFPERIGLVGPYKLSITTSRLSSRRDTQQHPHTRQAEHTPKVWCLVVWVRCSGGVGVLVGVWALNQHAHPLLSRQKGASLTQRATYVSNKRPHNHTVPSLQPCSTRTAPTMENFCLNVLHHQPHTIQNYPAPLLNANP